MMKRWLKILSGDGESSSEAINEEIQGITNQLHEVETELSNSETRLQESLILSLGSDQTGKETEDLGRLVGSLRDKRNTVRVVLERLNEKFDKAVKREISQEVQRIDLEIKNLEAERKKVCDEFFILAGRAAGLFSIINAGAASFTAGPNCSPMAMVGVAGDFSTSNFKLECTKSIDGREPFHKLIHELQLRKKALLAPPEPDMEA